MADYVSVTWTTGDIITETKLDNMVANDRSENAHESGLKLLNNTPLQIKDSGGTLREVLKATSGNNINLGNSNFSLLKILSGLELVEGSIYNCKVVASISTNDLVVSIKTLAGSDPSSTDPVIAVIAGGVRMITAALSVTIPATTTNSFNSGDAELTGKNVEYFPYLLWHTSSNAVRLIVAKFPYMLTYADFSSTATAENYGAINTGSPASTDRCIILPRFNATLTFSTPNYNWSIPSATSFAEIIRKTNWLSWQPAYSGSGSMTFTSVTTTKAEYMLDYNNCKIRFNISGTIGGTPSSNIILTLPITPTNDASTSIGCGYNGDSGYLGGMQPNIATPPTMLLSRVSGGNYTAGAGKQFTGFNEFRVSQ